MGGLRELAEGVHVLPGPTNIGVLLLPGGGALAVDSGLDESSARKLLRAVDALGRSLTAVVNTHSHADHVGGNRFLVERTGCKVLAPAAEASLLRAPIWEPIYLWGGARPPVALCNKFLMAPASSVDRLLEPGPVELFGLPLELVPLGGHSPGQLGVLVGDILFAADAYFDPPVLGKHGLPYFADPARALEDLQTVQDRAPGLVVPSHGEPLSAPSVALAANRRAILDGIELVADLLQEAGQALSTDEVVAGVLTAMRLHVAELGRYHLLRATVFSYLTYLTDRQRLTFHLEGGRLCWLPAT